MSNAPRFGRVLLAPAAALLSLAPAPLTPPADAAGLDRRPFRNLTKPERFFDHTYRYDFGDEGALEYHYVLFRPQPLDAAPLETQPPGAQATGGAGEGLLPMIVWLHGGRGVKKELKLHMTAVFDDESNYSQYRFYVLAVRSHPDVEAPCEIPEHAWSTTGGLADDQEDVRRESYSPLRDIIRQVVERERIDPNRITLTGLSAGGSGCWEMAVRNPDLFAAVAPLGGGAVDHDRASRLVDTPIWAFHGNADSQIDPADVRAVTEHLNRLGGDARLTLVDVEQFVDANDHFAWYPAFEWYGLRDWLLAQRRGDAASPPPGEITWAVRGERASRYARAAAGYWKAWSVAGVAVVIGLACLQEFRRRWKAANDLRGQPAAGP